MKLIWLIVLFPSIVLARFTFNSPNTNEVRTSAFCNLTVNTDGSVSLSFFSLDTQPTGNVAKVSVTPRTVTKTAAELTRDGSISGTLTVTATPNPIPANGYTVLFDILTMQSETIYPAMFFDNYFDYKFLEITGFQQGIIHFDIKAANRDLKQWLQSGEGIVLAQTFETNNVITVPNSQGSTTPTSINFVYEVPIADIIGATPGVYQFVIDIGMNPFTPLSRQATLENQVAILTLQRTTYAQLIVSINAELAGQNQLFILTDAERAQLIANRTFLQTQLDEINAIIARDQRILATLS